MRRLSRSGGRLALALTAILSAQGHPLAQDNVTVGGDVFADFTGSDGVQVGDAGPGFLLIEGGADLRARFLRIGGTGYQANGKATVIGEGTTLDIERYLVLAPVLGGGRLAIENGAVVTAGQVDLTSSQLAVPAAIRIAGRESKLLIEANPDSESTGALVIGPTGGGENNQVLVVDGGYLQSHRAIIDGGGTVSVDGPQSAWFVGRIAPPISLAGGHLTVGKRGSGRLVVRNGGSVLTGHADIGSHEGNVLVTGAGSLWTNQHHAQLNSGGIAVEEGGRIEIQNREDVRVALSLESPRSTLAITGAGSAVRVQGDVSVAAGSVVAGMPATVRVADGGALLLEPADGTGTVRVGHGGEGLLIIGAAEGDEAEAPGVVDADAVTLGSGSSTIVFNHTGQDHNFLPAMSGDGTLKVLAGSTALAGDAADFVGLTSITGGELILRNVLGGDVDIEAAGRLSGNGTVHGDTTVSGILTPAANGILEFAGGLTVERGGRLEIAADSAGRVGVVEVAGQVTLEEGAVLSLTSSDFFNLSEEHVILRSERVIDGRFSEMSSDLLFLTPILSHEDPTAVALSFERNELPMAKPAASHNQRSVASAIEELGPATPAYDALIRSTAETLKHSLEQLSGDAHATALAAKQQHMAKFRKELLKRTRKSGKTKRPRSAPPSLLHYAPPTGPQSSFRFPVEPLTPAPPEFATWLHGYSARGNMSGDENAAGSQSKSWGIVGGLEVPISDSGVLGLALGYQFDETRIADRSATADVSSLTGGIYGSQQLGAVDFRGGGSFTWNNIQSSRSISLPGLSGEAMAEYDSWSAQAYGEVGYLGELAETDLEPFVGLTYIHTRTGGFSETGLAGATLSAAGTSDFSVVGTLGLRVARTFTLEQGWLMRPQATVTWDHDFFAQKAELDLSFAGSPDSFGVTGPSASSDSLGISLGMEIERERFGVALSYEGRLSSGASEHAGLVKARVGF